MKRKITSIVALAFASLAIAAQTTQNWLTQISNKPFVDSRQFKFRAQSPGGSLSAGACSWTMSPIPDGLLTGDYLYLSGGTGAAESVQITLSGATASGTCANSHTGGWTVTSATDGVQQALNSLGLYTVGGTVKLADNTTTTFRGPLIINGNGNVPNYVIDGRGATITRGAAYPSGDLIYVECASNGASVTIDGVMINGAGSYGAWLNVTSGAAIHFHQCVGAHQVVRNVRVNDGYVGLDVDGTQQLYATDFSYFQQNMSPSTTPYAAIQFHGLSAGAENPTSNQVVGGVITTNGVTDADGITYGLLVQRSDGLQVEGVSIGGGVANGVVLQGTNAATIANVYFNNLLLDLNRTYAFRSYQASGTASLFSNISITNSHLNAENEYFPANASEDCIRIEAGSAYLISGNRIGYCGHHGIQLAGAGAINNVKISDNQIYNNNYSNSASTAGVTLNTSGSSNISITGNDIRNLDASGHQRYGILLEDATASKVTISGNSLSGNVTDTIGFTNTPTELVVVGNEGWVNNVATVSSGTTVALPNADVVLVTGSTQITTLNGGWSGRVVTLIFTGAAPGGVGSGGNIARTQAAVQNQPIRLAFNSATWY